MCSLNPYAVKAIVEHYFATDHLEIFVTFRFPMDTTVKPANDLWLCEVDDVTKAITVQAWQDAWTMLLTVPNIADQPAKVTLEYDGPDPNLRTTWDKQWEPWGPIISTAIPPGTTTKTFSTGPAQQNAVNVWNVNILFIDCSATDIIIAGFINGINGQVLHIAKTCAAVNNVTLKHNVNTGNQEIHLHVGADETLKSEYGGWILACNGSDWYDISHAKHV